MSRTRVPARAAVAAAAAATLLSGCASGLDAAAKEPYPASDGVVAQSGQIKVLNALVVAPANGDVSNVGSVGSVGRVGRVGRVGSVGIVSMTVVNKGSRPEQLTALETDAGTVDYTGPRVLASGRAVTFGAASNPSATIDGLTARPGETVTLELTFRNTEPIRLRTVVVPATGDYASITPAPEPPPITTPAEQPTDTTSPSPTTTTE